MPRLVEPSLSWDEAPDILTPKHLAELLGVSTKKANEIFNSREFPILSENVSKKGAYKYSVAKFLGIEIPIKKLIQMKFNQKQFKFRLLDSMKKQINSMKFNLKK